MTVKRYRMGLLAVVAGFVAASRVAPSLAADLKIDGLSGQSLVLTKDGVAALPHKDLTVTLEGKTVTFSGVPLTSVLERVGAPTGKALRGKALCDVVIVSGSDGYAVTLALAETDPMFRNGQVILADKADGAPLPETFGPLRLVVEGDLRGARFVRMVTGVIVLESPQCGASRGQER